MQKKATLKKPYTEEQKIEFIIEQNNHNGYTIQGEPPETLTAWGYTEAEKTQQRQAKFEKEFLTLEINKNFRLQPKGYANAQQSIDTINNMVNVLGGLTQEIATMVLFYETPDFTKPEQCTEEWLVQHQYSAEPMTKEQWTVFYIDFTTKYAQKMYQQQLLGEL